MGTLRFCLLLLVLTVAPCAYAQQAASDSIKTHALSEIWIRDPFILTDTLNQTYYLFGTTSSTQNQVLQDSIYTPAKTSFRGKVPMPFFVPTKASGDLKTIGHRNATSIKANTICLPPFLTRQPIFAVQPSWLLISPTVHLQNTQWAASLHKNGAHWMVPFT